MALNDAELGYPYLKRFEFEPSKNPQRFVGNGPESSMILLTDTPFPRLQVTFGGNDSVRPALEIDADEFIAVKGFKAKGKRITTYQLGEITELEPLRQPEPEQTAQTETIAEDTDEDPAEEAEASAGPTVIDGTLFDDI